MKYNKTFFDHVDMGAVSSAEIFARLLMPQLKPNSLLDVGCGRGGWLRSWKEAGCENVLGIDGDYVDPERLYVHRHEFEIADLNKSFDVGRRFDLVQSLEVGEHLDPDASQTFVDSIVRHGDVILFSAAVPGQGGTQHINERPLEFWRMLFWGRGYLPYDYLRRQLKRDVRIEPWYRYNSLLYANPAGRSRLSRPILETALPDGQPIPDVSTPYWQLRRRVLRLVPRAPIEGLVSLKHFLRLRLRGIDQSG